jgi:DNA-binding transcriptional MerR regulator
MAMKASIPDKLYFKIGEVAQLTGVKPHVLRYWETEFRGIQPVKSRGRQRLYRREDIELVLRLKDILYRQGYTIAGAKKILPQKFHSGPEMVSLPPGAGESWRLLREVREDLRRLRATLMRQD